MPSAPTGRSRVCLLAVIMALQALASPVMGGIDKYVGQKIVQIRFVSDDPLETDFLRFSGRLVKIQTKQPLQGTRSFRGILRGVEGETVLVELKNSEVVQIRLKEIAKANLDVDF